MHIRNITSAFLLALLVIGITFPANAEWKLFSDDFAKEEEERTKEASPIKENKTNTTDEGYKSKQQETSKKPQTPVAIKKKQAKEKTVPYCRHYAYLYNKNITIPNELKTPTPNKDKKASVATAKPIPANKQERDRFSLMTAVAMGYMSAIQDMTRSRINGKAMLKDLNSFCKQYPKAPYEDAVRAVTQVKKSVQDLIINEKKIWKKQQEQIGASPSTYQLGNDAYE
jgi:hypothetical protein